MYVSLHIISAYVPAGPFQDMPRGRDWNILIFDATLIPYMYSNIAISWEIFMGRPWIEDYFRYLIRIYLGSLEKMCYIHVNDAYYARSNEECMQMSVDICP